MNLLFYPTIRPGTQPDGLAFQVIVGFRGGLHGLTCADWFDEFSITEVSRNEAFLGIMISRLESEIRP
jgi:hypothetical protein